MKKQMMAVAGFVVCAWGALGSPEAFAGNVVAAHVCGVSGSVLADGIPSKDRHPNGDDFFDDLETALANRTTLAFPTVLADTDGAWNSDPDDPDHDSFTVPETGLYSVTYKSSSRSP